MTFEARDSAAKIVPARFRKSFPEKPPIKQENTRTRHSSVQTKWDSQGIYEGQCIQNGREISRQALTSAFIKFSKTLQTSVDSSVEYYDQRGGGQPLVKCPSAPSLVPDVLQDKKVVGMEAPRILRVCAPRPQVRRLSTNVLPRQTMSVDNPALREVYAAALPSFIGEGRADDEMDLGASATAVHHVQEEVDEDANLALDLHLPECPVTLSVRDSSRSPSATVNTEGENTSYNDSVTERRSSEVAGPSGIKTSSMKVDKQTSTADNPHFNSLGWPKSVNRSIISSSGNPGGSFREAKRSRGNRKVRRSETIDTASTHHRHRHSHHHHHGHHLHSDHRSSSARSVSVRSSNEGRKLVSSKSETSRRHQLMRQTKIEDLEDPKNHGPFNV